MNNKLFGCKIGVGVAASNAIIITITGLPLPSGCIGKLRFEKFVSDTYTSITSVHDEVEQSFDGSIPRDNAGVANGKAIKRMYSMMWS
jgi:hypothetical protein